MLEVLALLEAPGGVSSASSVMPDDAVHRGADLVAHVRQELALRLVGGFGGGLGADELLRR